MERTIPNEESAERPEAGSRRVSNVKAFAKGEFRRSCDEHGCEKRVRTDPAIFSAFLPGKAAFGDVDSWIEHAGAFLVLEFKREGRDLPRGQEIALRRLAALPEFMVMLVVANANDVRGYARITPSGVGEIIPATLDEVGARIAAWWTWAERHPHGRTELPAAA